MRARCLALALLLGCATGSEIGEDGPGLGGHGTGFGGEGGSGSSDGGSHSSSSPTSSGNGGDGATGVGGGSSVGGAGAGGGDTGGGQSGGAGGSSTCNFASPNACSNAQSLSSVSGDEGGTVMTTGNTSKWLVVQVTEDDSSIFETDLSYTATLTSPPGMVYNLVVHQGPQDGGPNCGAAPKNGTPPGGTVQTVSDSWDDDQGLGGEDDSVYLSIEVVYVSGDDCSAQWTLKVQGDT